MPQPRSPSSVATTRHAKPLGQEPQNVRRDRSCPRALARRSSDAHRSACRTLHTPGRLPGRWTGTRHRLVRAPSLGRIAGQVSRWLAAVASRRPNNHPLQRGPWGSRGWPGPAGTGSRAPARPTRVSPWVDVGRSPPELDARRHSRSSGHKPTRHRVARTLRCHHAPQEKAEVESRTVGERRWRR
jgi:hypothetical protein